MSCFSYQAKTIGFCVVMILFFSLILVPLNYLTDGDDDALVVVRGLGIELVVLVVTTVVFYPKLHFLVTGEELISTSSSTVGGTMSKNSSVTGSSLNVRPSRKPKRGKTTSKTTANLSTVSSEAARQLPVIVSPALAASPQGTPDHKRVVSLQDVKTDGHPKASPPDMAGGGTTARYSITTVTTVPASPAPVARASSILTPDAVKTGWSTSLRLLMLAW